MKRLHSLCSITEIWQIWSFMYYKTWTYSLFSLSFISNLEDNNDNNITKNTYNNFPTRMNKGIATHSLEIDSSQRGPWRVGLVPHYQPLHPSSPCITPCTPPGSFLEQSSPLLKQRLTYLPSGQRYNRVKKPLRDTWRAFLFPVSYRPRALIWRNLSTFACCKGNGVVFKCWPPCYTVPLGLVQWMDGDAISSKFNSILK